MVYDKTISISIGSSRKSVSWQNAQMLLSDLYNRLRDPVRSPETLAEYMRMPKSKQDDLKDVGGFVAGALSGPRRKANAVLGRDVVTLDFDNIPAWGTQGILDKLDSLGCGYCVYSTRKHAPNAPRLRILVPMDRTITADEYEPCARRIADCIGISMADPTTFDVSRLMYWPSVCADGEYVYEVQDRPLMSADFLLSTYVDWRDLTSWPQVPGSFSYQKLAVKQGDPETKPGLVGAFCRTYDIYKAIDELLPGLYAPVDNASDRYTYLGGSTTGGAIVYDNGKFLFSHHATDPCSGRLVNAWDLVRLHKFGELDDDAKDGTPTSRSPSTTAMKNFVIGLPGVQTERVSAALDFAGLETAPDDDGWKQQLDIASTGSLKNSLNNVCLLLDHDANFCGKLRKNLFSDRIEVLGKLPWDRPASKPWDDTDVDHLRVWLEPMLGKVSSNDIWSAVNVSADKRSFHPVKDYLRGLVWDGVPRLDTLFIDYLGAADTPYNRAICRKAFTAAVARIFCPGCKFDYMTVLVGGQGRYKSSIICLMGEPWFSDSLRTFEGKEAAEQLQGVWLVEVSELQAFDRSSIEAAKAFLSKRSDLYRAAYARAVKDRPRECVLFGTTNVPDFQRDSTGGRRFWPVDIDQQERTKDVFKDLPGERDQIWAEAVMRNNSQEDLFLSGELEEAAKTKQEEHREADPWEGLLAGFVEKQVPSDWAKWPLDRRRDFWAGATHGGVELVERKNICAIEFLCERLNFSPGSIQNRETLRVNKILRNLHGWEQCKVNCAAYPQQRGFRRL